MQLLARASRKQRRIAFWSVRYVPNIIWAIIVLIPFGLMLSGSLKTTESIYSLPYRWIPKNPSLGNFEYLIEQYEMLRYIMNSVIVAVSTVAIQSIVCALAGYAFGRMHFKGRDAIFLTCMFIMMVPYTTIIVPLFLMMNEIGWVNTFLPVVLPKALTYAYGVFIFRQFSTYIPVSLEESALIDGANYFQIFFRVVLPLLKPAYISIAILGGLGAWNDFMGPMVFLSTKARYTAQVALRFFTTQFSQDYPKLLAAVAIAILPVLILFFVLQRHFINSYMSAGVKG
jgi:multiple sugar transport system permease protein